MSLDNRTPSPTAYYPQGLLSCLYRLHTRLPIDFGLHAVFRLQGNANTAFKAFIQSDRHEALVTLAPTAEARCQQPAADWRPLRVRLVKYTVGQTVFSLATTLLDAALYRGPDLARL